MSERAARVVGDVLQTAAAEHPDREAYVDRGRRITYAELDRLSRGFAATLLGHGVSRGDVVCLLLPSSADFAICYLGALQIGAITSAINLRLGSSEQASIFERSAPALTVLADGVTPPATVDLGVQLAAGDLSAAFATEPVTDDQLPALEPTDTTCVVWTSGTTGAPKGAIYDHATQAAIHRNMGELTLPGDRRLVVLPFPHVGYMTRVWDELAAGTTIVLATDPWSPEEHLRLIRDEAITMAQGVPTQWEKVLAHPDLPSTDFSHVRLAGIGAASIAPELIRRMRETLGCPVMVRYTSTELGIATGTHLGDSDEVVATTVGTPAPDVELRIVDVQTGARAGIDEPGEIVCRSPAQFKGYWQDPETTAAVVDEDGFLHTGDLGMVGADGNLRIVGRLKEMYIRGGYNVYPAEVESVLVDHPAVAQAAVIGVPTPVLGERGVAFVVAEDAAAPPTLDDLRAWCRAHLADYKAPDDVVVVDQLPVTPMMKIDKQVLARTAEGLQK